MDAAMRVSPQLIALTLTLILTLSVFLFIYLSLSHCLKPQTLHQVMDAATRVAGAAAGGGLGGHAARTLAALQAYPRHPALYFQNLYYMYR